MAPKKEGKQPTPEQLKAIREKIRKAKADLAKAGVKIPRPPRQEPPPHNEGFEPFPMAPLVIVEDYCVFTPREIRKYGFRLAKGMEYRPYTMTEIRKYIAEGKMVPMKAGKREK